MIMVQIYNLQNKSFLFLNEVFDLKLYSFFRTQWLMSHK
jgi:hypothetical protein